MSVAFPPARARAKGHVTQHAIQTMLDENNHLIQCIMDYQSKGKSDECTQYQQILHRNLVYLATIADSNQNMQSLLPAPPTPNMSMGPGGMGQSGGHAPNHLNDAMAPGLPPASVMQSQMSNASMTHQQSAAPHYSSAQVGGQHYQGQPAMMGAGAQGNGVMPQRPLGSYRSAQPGHGEYSYQQSSYGEQGYDGSFGDSPQHYYEGGNPQCSQQQAQYQQGSGQQQYSSQQGYGGTPHGGYGAGQAGSSQYPQYQRGQSGQYGSYRPSQGGSGAPTQRPRAYETGQYGNYQQ